jgi:hypothetical protein
MRLSELKKLVAQLTAGGGGGGGASGGVPDLTQETNPINLNTQGAGLDGDGLLPGPINLQLRQGSLAYNNEDGTLDPTKAYLVVAAYVITDPDTDWGGLDLLEGEFGPGMAMARVESLAGPATLDATGLRSTVMPVGLDLNVALGTAGCRLSNIQLFPIH